MLSGGGVLRRSCPMPGRPRAGLEVTMFASCIVLSLFFMLSLRMDCRRSRLHSCEPMVESSWRVIGQCCNRRRCMLLLAPRVCALMVLYTISKDACTSCMVRCCRMCSHRSGMRRGIGGAVNLMWSSSSVQEVGCACLGSAGCPREVRVERV